MARISHWGFKYDTAESPYELQDLSKSLSTAGKDSEERHKGCK